MLYLVVLILLIILLQLFVKRVLQNNLLKKEQNYEDLKTEHANLSQENGSLKKDNIELESTAEETIALYDITKSICKSLDEVKIFNIFKEKINRYVELRDCRFLKSDVDLSQYKDYTILPLKIHKNIIGYLIAMDIREKDKDKFHILTQQFLMGIKRALLYQKVQELTILDGLTQIFSRRYFIERFEEELKRSEKFNLNMSFLMVDIDHFKDYNDRYGHLVGDATLREVTKTIRETIRQIDFMGRYGGEELSIILAETDKTQASFAAERIRKAMESKEISVYDEILKVTISIGISTFPEDSKDPNVIIDKADQALYLAKGSGRNKVCAYTGT